MKVYGIFRGFPGLGRVMSGLTLLSTLENKYGAEIKVYTYMQGQSALELFRYNRTPDIDILSQNITSVGLDPVSKVSAEIINDILNWKPDIVLIDGEPLLTKLLCICYDKEKIITLLNPSDLNNSVLPYSTSIFFKDAFLSGSCAIVHGINCDTISDFVEKDCKVFFINTILREKIIKLKSNEKEKKSISCILGGGSKSFSGNFIDSTVMMGKNIIKVASKYDKYTFNVFCNDEIIYHQLDDFNTEKNVKIYKNIADVDTLYKDAKLIICRAGRNTSSEVLYLDIPNILIAAGNDYRANEQKSNIKNIVDSFPNSTDFFDNENYNELDIKIQRMLTKKNINNSFIPGNQKAIEIILNQIKENNKNDI